MCRSICCLDPKWTGLPGFPFGHKFNAPKRPKYRAHYCRICGRTKGAHEVAGREVTKAQNAATVAAIRRANAAGRTRRP
jgi:hypothetical protein